MGKFNVLEYSTGKIINSPSEIEWCVHTTNSSRTIRLKVRLVGLLTGSPGKAKASSSSHIAGTSVSYDSKTEKKQKSHAKLPSPESSKQLKFYHKTSISPLSS